MRLRFRSSFARDLKAIKDKTVLSQVKEVIGEIERAERIEAVSGVSRLSGGRGYYRIRIGDYRIGLIFDGGEVELVRCLHRREIYRYFP